MRIDLVLDPAVHCDGCGVPARVTLETEEAPADPGYVGLCFGCLIMELLERASFATATADAFDLRTVTADALEAGIVAGISPLCIHGIPCDRYCRRCPHQSRRGRHRRRARVH